MDMIKEIMLHDDLMDTLLRYGLFLGAIFQIVCIGAVVIMPDYKSEYMNDSDGSEDEPGSDQGSPTHTSSSHRHPRNSKREKKKRR